MLRFRIDDSVKVRIEDRVRANCPHCAPFRPVNIAFTVGHSPWTMLTLMLRLTLRLTLTLTLAQTLTLTLVSTLTLTLTLTLLTLNANRNPNPPNPNRMPMLTMGK